MGNSSAGRVRGPVALCVVAAAVLVPAPVASSDQSAPSAARNIRLCHGDSPVSSCATANQTTTAGSVEQVSAFVTDASGNPVEGVPVEFRESGPAYFTANGADAVVVTTDPGGVAVAAVTTGADGDSSVVAEISPQGLSGGFRGPGATDDACEQPAGPGGSPSAGNCGAGPLTITWVVDDFPTECGDGVDNDRDGWVDMEDPSCDSPEDDSEHPFDGLNEHPRFDRTVNLHFDHEGSGKKDLVVWGRVKVTDGEPSHECARGQPVNVQRRVDGRWVTKATVTTTSWGRYEASLPDVRARYRAVALRSEVLVEEIDTFYVCQKTAKHKRHGHR